MDGPKVVQNIQVAIQENIFMILIKKSVQSASEHLYIEVKLHVQPVA